MPAALDMLARCLRLARTLENEPDVGFPPEAPEGLVAQFDEAVAAGDDEARDAAAERLCELGFIEINRFGPPRPEPLADPGRAP